MVLPCGSRTVVLSITVTKAFMVSSDYMPVRLIAAASLRLRNVMSVDFGERLASNGQQMKLLGRSLAVGFFAFAAMFIQAQSAKSDPANALVMGDWNGTSICLVRPSACHDEEALYHV